MGSLLLGRSALPLLKELARLETNLIVNYTKERRSEPHEKWSSADSIECRIAIPTEELPLLSYQQMTDIRHDFLHKERCIILKGSLL